ncbi:hypothetical protein C0Z19_25765 [Trinickia soli]|uniref:Uncharacterized protein n=1 Tax=Trinickia soli TaxID=380675 RepID=A0A2N7VGY0_9BURK|nr:hypothetical protein C0Z19_25765 [Trinickia soli]
MRRASRGRGVGGMSARLSESTMHAAVPAAGAAFDERIASIAASMRAPAGTGMRFSYGWPFFRYSDDNSHRLVLMAEGSVVMGPRAV